jgi:hypothetical protein
MSAIDPLRRDPRRRFHAVEPIESPGAEERPAAPDSRTENAKCSYRPAGADFFCWKYGVWYNLMDCCYRHERQTFSGCSDCGQGASNLRVNRARYAAARPYRDRSTDR